METKATYTAGNDPFEELRTLMQEEEAAWLVRLIRLVNDAGGWGKIELVFKRSRLTRPIATVTAGEEDCNL